MAQCIRCKTTIDERQPKASRCCTRMEVGKEGHSQVVKHDFPPKHPPPLLPLQFPLVHPPIQGCPGCSWSVVVASKPHRTSGTNHFSNLQLKTRGKGKHEGKIIHTNEHTRVIVTRQSRAENKGTYQSINNPTPFLFSSLETTSGRGLQSDLRH